MRFAGNTASVSLLFINGTANMADWMYSKSLKMKELQKGIRVVGLTPDQIPNFFRKAA